MLTAAIARSLPIPTESQCRAFAEHLVTVHSWYKHLPLFEGGEFIVFLAPDAGENYPTLHPRVPTENTLSGYRLAFGHLDYIYRSGPTERFDRDGPPPPELDDELAGIGRFHLFPYVSPDFYWSVHEPDVALIRSGTRHPHADAILNAYDADQRMTQCWDHLSDSDREIIVGIDECDSLPDAPSFPDPIARYLQLELASRETYAFLQDPEILKIRRCVLRLRQWLATP